MIVQAKAGDRLIIEGKTVDAPRREGEIVEVRGEAGAAPYFVRWDDGHEGLVFPGPDALVQPG